MRPRRATRLREIESFVKERKKECVPDNCVPAPFLLRGFYEMSRKARG